MLTRVLIAVVLILGLAGAVSAEEIKVEALGITDHAVSQEGLEKGEALAKPKFDSPGIAHGMVANVKKGDTVVVSLVKDGSPLMHNTRTLEVDEDHVTGLDRIARPLEVRRAEDPVRVPHVAGAAQDRNQQNCDDQEHKNLFHALPPLHDTDAAIATAIFLASASVSALNPTGRCSEAQLPSSITSPTP